MRREPLAVRAAVVAACTAVLHLAVLLNWIDLGEEAERAVVTVVDLLAALIIVLWTRPAVTPLADPRDRQGRALMSVPDAVGAVEATHPVEVAKARRRAILHRRQRERDSDLGYGLIEVLVAVVLVILIVWLLVYLL